MKKPNFNPLFYSFFVYDTSLGPEGRASSVTFVSSEKKEKTSEGVSSNEEKINSSTISQERKECKLKRDELLNSLKNTIGDKDKDALKKMRSEISNYYRKAAFRMSPQMTRTQFEQFQSKIIEKTNEFKAKLEKMSQVIKQKEEAIKEIKKTTEALINKYQLLLLDDRYKKKCEQKHVLYMTSAYLLRWEKVNEDAVKRIRYDDLDTTVKVLSDLKQKKGGAFKDLAVIEQDIMKVMDQWADSEGNEDDRKVYLDRHWDNKYEKKMPEYSYLAATGNQIYKGISDPLVGLSNPLTAGVVGYRYLTGKKQLFNQGLGVKRKGPSAKDWALSVAFPTVAIGSAAYKFLTGEKKLSGGLSVYDIKGYLKWARERAEKGKSESDKYPPLPDLERINKKGEFYRWRLQITAGIKPPKIRRNIEFGNRVGDFRNKLAEAGKKDKILFGIPELSETKDEGNIAIQKDNKNIAKIQVAPGGKYYLVVKNKKVDVTTMAPAEVIKQVQELALSPTVDNIKVSKSGGRALVKIEGNNIPSDKSSLDLRKGNIQLSKSAMGVSDFRLPKSFATIDENMKSTLKEALMDYAKSQSGPKFQKQLESKITDKLLEDLKAKVYPKSKKPRIVITGKASLEGNWNQNQALAKRRADTALRRLQEKNPNLTKANYDIKVVHFVAGPDGNPVASEKEGWNKMLAEWKKNEKKLGKVKSVKELKKKLRTARSGPAAEFVKKSFNNQRGADLLILPPASNDVNFDIVSGNPTASAPSTSASNPGPTS